MGYRAEIHYYFDIGEQVFELIPESSTFVSVSETEFNGQEDTHMSGDLELVDGVWEWVEGGSYLFDFYDSPGTSAAIRDYLNKHPIPVIE